MKRNLLCTTIFISVMMLCAGCATRDSETARNERTPGYVKNEESASPADAGSSKAVAAQSDGSTDTAGTDTQESAPEGSESEITEYATIYIGGFRPDKKPEKEDVDPDATDYPEAYEKAIAKVKESMVLPDGARMNFKGLSDIEDTDFCIRDIDFDGTKELMVRYAGSNITPSKTAKNAEIEYMRSHDPEDAFIGIYEYKPKRRSFVCELFTTRDSFFYDNGVVISNLTNYKNLAMSGKNYNVYFYNAETDTYDLAGSVDTWDGFEHPEDDNKNPFPAQYDLDEDKIVYSINFGEEYPEGFVYDYETLGALEDKLKGKRIGLSWEHR